MKAAVIILLSALSALFLAFFLFLFLMKPSKRRLGVEKFKGLKYAHRGLWGEGVPENSLSAHRRAADSGYAIELDVRLSRDGVAVVFHDDTLDRMTKLTGRVDSLTAEELSKALLLDTDEGIPTFKDVLSAVGGRVALLIELKGRDLSVADRVKEALMDYSGDFIIESFNPRILARVKKIMPSAIRGILSKGYMADRKTRTLPHFFLEWMLLNFLSRPDVIAYRHTDGNNLPLRLIRRLYGTDTVAWTVRSDSEEQEARQNGFDAVVFEKYLPKEKNYEI